MFSNKNKPLNNNFIHFFQKMNKVSKKHDALVKDPGPDLNVREDLRLGDRAGRPDQSKVGQLLNNQLPKRMLDERASKLLLQQAQPANREAPQKQAAPNRRLSGMLHPGQADSKLETHPAIPEFLDVASSSI